jgi:hypothetical protein
VFRGSRSRSQSGTLRHERPPTSPPPVHAPVLPLALARALALFPPRPPCALAQRSVPLTAQAASGGDGTSGGESESESKSKSGSGRTSRPSAFHSPLGVSASWREAILIRLSYPAASSASCRTGWIRPQARLGRRRSPNRGRWPLARVQRPRATSELPSPSLMLMLMLLLRSLLGVLAPWRSDQSLSPPGSPQAAMGYRRGRARTGAGARARARVGVGGHPGLQPSTLPLASLRLGVMSLPLRRNRSVKSAARGSTFGALAGRRDNRGRLSYHGAPPVGGRQTPVSGYPSPFLALARLRAGGYYLRH